LPGYAFILLNYLTSSLTHHIADFAAKGLSGVEPERLCGYPVVPSPFTLASHSVQNRKSIAEPIAIYEAYGQTQGWTEDSTELRKRCRHRYHPDLRFAFPNTSIVEAGRVELPSLHIYSAHLFSMLSHVGPFAVTGGAGHDNPNIIPLATSKGCQPPVFPGVSRFINLTISESD